MADEGLTGTGESTSAFPADGTVRFLQGVTPLFVGQPAYDIQRLLTDEEVEALSVRRGSLTTQEFDEIRGHVSHTYKFLSQIPWGKALRRVPIIAGAHHERLNGTGYPNRLRAEEIPVQSKMMSISDIYDALTASDRPYKKAVPPEKALDILKLEVKDGMLDPVLVDLFIEAKVYEKTLHLRAGVRAT